MVGLRRRRGGVIVIRITVWSEPEGGRLFFKLWTKGRRWLLAKQTSMTLDLWDLALVMCVYEPGVLRRECSVSRAAKK
jgi:hypothetical protein